MEFDGKTVAITGGATGIGFALGKAIGGEGARVVIGGPRQKRLDEALAAFADLGIEAHATVLDVTDPESVEAFADFAWEKGGTVELLINNAGIGLPQKRMIDLPLEQLHAVFDVNVFGVWHGCASFGGRMIKQDGDAAIYNIASENAFFTAVPNSAAYVASKHAVMGLTEAFREEMPDHVSVGTIFPGWVASEIMPPEAARHAMDADRFANIVVEQICAGEKFIVSHAFNIEHIDKRHRELSDAFARYAPRYEGDDEYDVPSFIAKMQRGE